MTQSETHRRIFVTGGTGFVGQALTEALLDRGDQVVVLSRDATKAKSRVDSRAALIQGDPTVAGAWQQSIAGASAVVNLAGHPVAGRWNAQYRQLINDSRVESTRYIVEAIAAIDQEQRPAVLVNASGIDYYPFSVDLGFGDDMDCDEVTEEAVAGDSALARICQRWEAEAHEAEPLGVRVVLYRVGLVLGPGGLLAKLLLPFRFGLGGRLGSGKQWMSWVHLDDIVSGILFAIDHPDIVGPVNAVAPNPVRNHQFTAALAKALRRPAFVPTPGFVLRAVLGELAEYALNGRRAVPAKLLTHGFQFQFPMINDAFQHILAEN